MKHSTSAIIFIVACSWCLMGFTWGDPLSRNVKRGNRLFDAGQYAEALQAFTEADVKSVSGDSRLPQLYQNMGNTLTKLGKFDEAAAMYKKAADAAKTAALKADAQFNAGNARMKQQQYQQAVEAYTQALNLNPNHREARQNKELAEKLAAQQQQEKQQQKNQQDNQQKQNQQQQQQKSSQDQQKQQEQEKQQNQQDQQKQQDQQPKDQQQQNQQQKPEEQPQPKERQAAQAEQSPQDKARQLPKEEALRILDALKEKEQSRQQQHQVAPRPVEKDW